MQIKINELEWGDKISVNQNGNSSVTGMVIDINDSDLPLSDIYIPKTFDLFIYLDKEYRGRYRYMYDPYYGINDNMNIQLIKKNNDTKSKPKKIVPAEFICPECGDEGRWKGMIMICINCFHKWYYTG